MLEYTRLEPLIEIRATGDNILRRPAQGSLLVVVRNTEDVLRMVRLPIVLVSGLKRNLSFILAAAQKGVKTVIENNGSSLDLERFNIQLTRLDNMDYFGLTIAKQNKRTEFALCEISGKTFGKESILTALVPKKPVALSVGSMNINEKVVENA